ncbi:GRAM domain-containing protein [Sarracenia purpurea var. burkii]
MAVAPACAEKSETSQSMDSSPSRRISDAASDFSSSPSRRVSDAASGGLSSTATDPANSSPNYAKDLEIPTQASVKSEEYRQLFHLPPEEVLIQDFNCALQESFLLQGHMYLFGRHVCFYSNLFGFETKKVIRFHEVTSVRRAKAAGIFPTSIEIMAGGKKYYFTSFLSRDEAFKLINDGWSQYGNGAKEITDLQDSKLEFNIKENGDVETEKAKSSEQLVDESDFSERHMDISILEDSMLPLEAEIETESSLGVRDDVEEDAEAVVNNESFSSGKNLACIEENSDAPEVPDYFTKVAESNFPIRVEEFFSLFFSDDAVDFLESYHKRCGDRDFMCGSWYPHDKFGHARDVSFQHPIKIYLGAKYGSCQEVQKFRVYRNSRLVVETSQEVTDVPYGDYFHVEGLWDVDGDGSESKRSCILRVYVNVAFTKKTMWKGKIVQSTIEEAGDTYAIWIKTAHELLQQKKIEKEEANLVMNVEVREDREAKTGEALLLEVTRAPAANFIMSGEVQEDREAKTGEPLEGSKGPGDTRTSQILPGSKDVNQLVGDALQGTSNGSSSLTSSFLDSMMKFSMSLKSQSQVPLLLVIILAMILLLMQLSIVVLLSRPQQIQLIPQADYHSATCSVSERMPEMKMAWLEQRIHHLKDEMATIETVLKKMQHEHSFLETQMKDIEQFIRQRR